jgi:hypothetical protein
MFFREHSFFVFTCLYKQVSDSDKDNNKKCCGVGIILKFGPFSFFDEELVEYPKDTKRDKNANA